MNPEETQKIINRSKALVAQTQAEGSKPFEGSSFGTTPIAPPPADTSTLKTQANFRLPSGEIIPATINPNQAPTVSIEDVLSGKVASDVPQVLLDLGRQQLEAKSPTIGGVRDLQDNAELAALDTKIEDISSRLAAGIRTRGAVDILGGLFTKFGIAEEQSLINEFNTQILETQQRLREIPEDVKETLQDVGVSEAQLNRLILKETQKPLETLQGLMEQRGVAQDRINQSLRFVGLFADAAMQDKAAKLEAMEFELEQAQGKFAELKEGQKELAKLALTDKKTQLTFANDLLQKGAPQDIIEQVQNASDLETAQRLAQPFLVSRASIDAAKDVASGIAATIADMSDQAALDFIRKRAQELNIDENVLLDAVAGEEKVGSDFSGTKTEQTQISRAGLSNAPSNVKSFFISSEPAFQDAFIREIQSSGVTLENVTMEQMQQARENWLKQESDTDNPFAETSESTSLFDTGDTETIKDDNPFITSEVTTKRSGGILNTLAKFIGIGPFRIGN